MNLKTFVTLLGSQIPALGLLLALGGVAYLGHRTGWKIPNIAALRGGTSAPGQGEKPDSGDDQDSNKAIKVIPGTTEKASDEKPSQEPQGCPLNQTRVRFSSTEGVEKAGIESEKVEVRSLDTEVTAPAEINYDETRVSRLSAPVPGKVWRVEKQIGDRVMKGEVLALVEASKVGDAKAEFLQAVVQVKLKTTTLESLQTAGGAVPGHQLREAQADLEAAQVRLFNAQQALINLGLPVRREDTDMLSGEQLAKRVQFLGLPESVVRSLNPETTTANLIPVTAQFNGVVVERKVVAGEVVESSTTLFVVADLSRVWVMMGIGLEDAEQLALDQSVTFVPEGGRAEVVKGVISWISTTADEKTRTMPARAVLDNPKRRLRAHTFGTARVTVRHRPEVLVVPAEAVQEDGPCHFVFVSLSDTEFQVREVECGETQGRDTEIRTGLKAAEVVVTKGSHLLKTEILKGRVAGDTD